MGGVDDRVAEQRFASFDMPDGLQLPHAWASLDGEVQVIGP